MSSPVDRPVGEVRPADTGVDRPADTGIGRPAGGVGRDRDAAGRPRNARPRDELGRPLPRGAAGVEPIPDDLALAPPEALDEAQRLLDAGRAFQAHEVLESAWKAAPDDEREFWQGLAQFAVGLTHVQRGNAVGAARLLSRAADRVERYRDAAPHGVQVVRLAGWARDLVGRIQRDGLAGLTADDLTPRLRS